MQHISATPPLFPGFDEECCDYDGIVSELLNLRGLTVELPTTAGWVRPVNEVSLHIAAGEALELVGESGSGKTILSLALMGLLPAGARTAGEIWLRATKEIEEVKEGKEIKDSAASPAAGGKDLVGLGEEEWRQVRGREIGMIFQEPMTSLNPVMRAGQFVEFGSARLILEHPEGGTAKSCSRPCGRYRALANCDIFPSGPP